ncbi:hypothetical protein JK358_08860 [Nocardia sp. 2]|uniref:Uncharacterized protein n=1 Tax=Nocardia acididurans TaxID=2802282 RepID=A0ABS1M1X6_9NOCA|nr:hypothetical protein [Nocardia acididurans]MBL1074506.1 hypothetical protein [Nocardia acididurans]
MGRNSTVCLMIAAAAIAVAGCDSVAGVPDASPASSTSTAVAPTTAPAAPPEPNDGAAEGLPLCALGSAVPLPDCTLESHDATGRTFDVKRTGIGNAITLTIDVFDADGTATQTISEPDTQALADNPKLRDIDGDGRDELIVPLQAAGANTAYAIYHSADGVEYTRAGEVSGLGIESTPDGYTAISAKNGTQGWDISFWTFESGTLTPLLTAQVTFVYDGNQKVVDNQCTVVDDGGLYSTGVQSQAAARAKFCAEPVVTRVMYR